MTKLNKAGLNDQDPIEGFDQEEEVDDEELFSFSPSEAIKEGDGEPTADGLYEHFRFVADRGQSQMRVDKFLTDRIVGTSQQGAACCR